MTPSSGPGRSSRSAALGRALLDVKRTATTAADALLDLVPDTGDQATGWVVDDFVEQAGDALRTVAELLGETLGQLDAPGSPAAPDHLQERSGRDGVPRGSGS